jgi:hypothetical protein
MSNEMPDFDELVGNGDAAPVEGDGYLYVEEIGAWIVKADKSVWTEFEPMLHHVNAATIEAALEEYMSHVEATARDELTVPARAGGVITRGPLKGKKREARPEKVPTDRAVKQHVSKIRAAVEDYLKWKVAQVS